MCAFWVLGTIILIAAVMIAWGFHINGRKGYDLE